MGPRRRIRDDTDTLYQTLPSSHGVCLHCWHNTTTDYNYKSHQNSSAAPYHITGSNSSIDNITTSTTINNSSSNIPMVIARMVYALFLFGIILESTMTTVVADNSDADPNIIPIPNFSQLKAHYPGYARWGGDYHNHQLVQAIGCDTTLLLHDTTALRLSAALNAIGGAHSLGHEMIRLSKYGRDSVLGKDGLQYMYHPIAYGPYLADKYGYPTVSKLHQNDPIETKKNFWGKQGVLRVITYTKKGHMPKGHVALWDCNHFHQARDWIAGHSLITVEFWESPDSDCSTMPPVPTPDYPDALGLLHKIRPDAHPAKLRHHHWEKRFLNKYFQTHKTKGTYNNVHYKNVLSTFANSNNKENHDNH